MVRTFALAALLATASTAVTALSLPALARRQGRIAVCDCGVIDTTDPNQAIWTDYFERDFRTMSRSDVEKDFVVMSYDIKRPVGFSRSYEPGNLRVDSEGLKLTVSPANAQGEVPSAGILTKHKEFGFGHYTIETMSSQDAGLVQAFYNYASDDNEVDMEYVSTQNATQRLRNSVKPQIYQANGQADPATYAEIVPPNGRDLGSTSNTWSFIWNSSAVAFGLNDVYSQLITTNVPQKPGTLAISAWSDGNPRFSGGPPAENATVVVTRLWAVYNATGGSLQCKQRQAACGIAEAAEAKTPNAYNAAVPGRAVSSALAVTAAALATCAGLLL